jgi:AAA+ ATPase superfamily predicted ATPase
MATFVERAGGLEATPLTRALTTLRAKRIVSLDQPLSTLRSKVPRYRVTDPYLRFWLAFIGPAMAEIERGPMSASWPG